MGCAQAAEHWAARAARAAWHTVVPRRRVPAEVLAGDQMLLLKRWNHGAVKPTRSRASSVHPRPQRVSFSKERRGSVVEETQALRQQVLAATNTSSWRQGNAPQLSLCAPSPHALAAIVTARFGL